MPNFPLLALLFHKNQFFSFKLFLGRRNVAEQEGRHFSGKGPTCCHSWPKVSLWVSWAFLAKMMESGKALLCYTRDMRGWEGGIYQQHKKRWGRFADKMSVNMLTRHHQAMHHQMCSNSNCLVGKCKRMECRKCLDSHAHHEPHLSLKTSSIGDKILNRMYH